MIIVPVKDGENIERALKKFKRKFEKTGAVREMRSQRRRPSMCSISVSRKISRISPFLEICKTSPNRAGLYF